MVSPSPLTLVSSSACWALKGPEKIHSIIAFCPQEPAYYGYLSGQENIEIFGMFHGIEPKLLRERMTQEEELT